MALAKNQKEAADHARQTAEKNIKAREAKVAAEAAKLNDNDGRVASAEAELVKTQTEKSDLQSKLQANEAQILELQKHIEEMSKSPSNPNPGAPSVPELQAQLDDARKQLENAEHEKTFLTEKLQPGTARTNAWTRGYGATASRSNLAPFGSWNRAGGESGV